MFGRCTRLVALFAVVSHVWVALIAAPWHHLADHVLPLVQATTVQGTATSAKGCRCHHHSQCQTLPSACDLSRSDSSQPPASDDEDNCAVCQVLSQPFAQPETSVSVVMWEVQEFQPTITAVLPLLVALADPVSRGPPLA